VASGRRSLLAVTAAATQVFTAPPRRPTAVSYLNQRGIDVGDLPDHWRLGYAPPGWTRLIDALRGHFPDTLLLDAGLATQSSRGTLIDTFRDRVMFPIHDADGQVAGFIGRDLSGHPEAPKYLNTRQNPLFCKGELLYGLHEGRAINPAAQQPVLVEGPLDVLAIAAAAGSNNRTDLLPVAASGTAFTDAHARLVADAAADRRVTVALDGDCAGRAAALRAGEQLRAAGLDVRLALLPTGVDPADHLAGRGATLDVFSHEHAIPLLTVRVQHEIAAQGDRMQWVEGRLAAGRCIARNLATYPVAHAAAQIGWIAKALDLDSSTVTFELANAYSRRTPARPSVESPLPREAESIAI
jgi:DNA primase